MKILIFTEGTALTFQSGKDINREEQVKQSALEGIQREEASLTYNSIEEVPVKPNSVHDYDHYVPIGNVVEKLTNWKSQGAQIYYLTSRRIKKEIDAIQNILKSNNFPDSDNLFFRQQNETYAQVAEKLIPDILIEDDCESIGGEKEMTYPNMKEDIKNKVKSIPVKEFGGIDHLPDSLDQLMNYE